MLLFVHVVSPYLGTPSLAGSKRAQVPPPLTSEYGTSRVLFVVRQRMRYLQPRTVDIIIFFIHLDYVSTPKGIDD
jgi:hypothetical protein